MSDSAPAATRATTPPPGPTPLAVGQRIDELDALLRAVGGQSAAETPPVVGPQEDNRLVQVRLGIAQGLHTALRCRHPATAAHVLRVGLTCSAWAVRLELSSAERDAIEVAALLHDVGVIGVPDQALLKPGPLDQDEVRVFEQSRRMSVEILRTACAEPEILAIVENVPAWYDGSRPGYRVCGAAIPRGARMIAIAEAYDAMTTDQVFRRALSQERAVGELFQKAGTQFDPEFVRDFVPLAVADPSDLRRRTARAWLQSLDPEAANSFWQAGAAPAPAGPADDALLFEDRLLDQMHDAVLFIDADLRVLRWNHGAERLTGIAASAVCQRSWAPGLLGMQNEKGERIGDDDCPVLSALHSGVQSLRRLTICGRTGRPVYVDCHAIPVAAADGRVRGAVLLVHDASQETTLEQRCQSLHEKATRDPLTQVANRAEFDRVLELFITTHRERQVPCSLIMCDIDHFKQVNDNYGHPAGDEAIKVLAGLLRNSCRAGDLVARYGGEEFVMLCANCDNATAARRAEQVRKALAGSPQSALGGRPITASFGVTEVQPGDTPETMLRRADRALLMAKESGRNRVVQLGVGSESGPDAAPPRDPPARPATGSIVLRQVLVTPVPIPVAVEKLRGFIADHRAQVIRIEGNRVELHIAAGQTPMRRASDRPVTFRLQLQMEEDQMQSERADAGTCVSRTRLHVSIAPLKDRDRRRADAAQRAREVMASLRSYLMAARESEEETEEQPPETVLTRLGRLLLPGRKR